MINLCPCCNKPPKERGLISCENEKCLEFGEEFFIWTWQARVKSESGEINIDKEGLTFS